MKRTVRLVAQVAGLAAATLALIATSDFTPIDSVPGPGCSDIAPTPFWASTSCGPAGDVWISANSSCVVTVQGGEKVNLPLSGDSLGLEGDDLLAGGWTFYGQVFVRYPFLPDGGVLADAGEAAPDGGRFFPTTVYECTTTPGDAGTLVVVCSEGGVPNVCGGELTRK